MTGTAAEATQTATLGDKLRHIGVSLLPLGVFVAGALGYEQIVHATRAPVTKSVAAVIAPPVVKTTPATAQRTLRDERSLVDLAQSASIEAGTGGGERQLRLTLGDNAPIALGFDMQAALQPGSYGILRGVPPSATLSHGIAAGSDSWLVDGSEIGALKLGMRSGKAGALGLELTLLSRDSRPLARERVAITLSDAISAEPRVQGQPQTQTHIVPPAPIAMPAAAPAIEAPGVTADVPPAAVIAAAPARVAPVTGAGPMRLSLTRAAAGSQHNLRLWIEPNVAIPDGAYVLLRGLPASTTMSRGMAIGPDVWLLSMPEVDGLEMRWPETAPRVVLEAKLLTADGRLLAEQTINADASPAANPVVVASGAAPGLATESNVVREVKLQAEAPATSPATTRLAAVVPQATPPEVSRPGVPVAAPAARVTQRTPALDVPAYQAIYERGRKMLMTGNIAVARPLLERAFTGGSAEAAALLGASYDPKWLKGAGALGVVDDPAKASHWYAEARRLGAQDVERIVAATLPAAPRR